MDHPPASHFDLLLCGELSPADTHDLVLHLLRLPGCPTCAAHWFSRDSPDYEGLLDRLGGLGEAATGDAGGPPPAVLWMGLRALSPEKRALSLQRRRYRTPAFALWLIRHSLELAPSDPEFALLAAEVAETVLSHLARHAVLGEVVLHRLRAAALAHLGNAYRCLGRFVEAWSAFLDAERELEAGEPDPLDRVQFLSLRANLHKDLGRFREAARDLKTAFRLGRRHAAPHARGRILLQLAEVAGFARPALGVRILDAARPLLDFQREPRLEIVLVHRRIWFLNDAGQPALALQAFRASWPLYARWTELRIRGLRWWLWGRIERSLGDLVQAEVYLSRAVDLFRELGHAHDHAVSGLDLADVYLRLGQPEAARRLLDEGAEFLKKHLHAEGLELWLTLARSTLTPALLYEAVAYYLRHWHAPGETGA
jgi:tetratricopeptide (TPR) repeat protein